MNHTELYQDKNVQYFGVTQTWVADYIPAKLSRVLEVGCGNGATGAWLKSIGKAEEVHGVELIEDAAEIARTVLDSVVVGNIEELDLSYPLKSFDCIIATEVLEHLVNPWNTVQRLATYLRDGGCIIASSPNVRHFSVLWRLVFLGRWRYTDAGIMDRSHLRFFTRDSLAGLFTQAGLKIEYLEPILFNRSRRLNQISLGIWQDFLAHRYKCKANKS